MEDIYYLVHITNNYKHWSELQTTSIDNWDHQFPGVYLTLITKYNIDSERLFPGKYVLIFSYELLKQKNYHINIRDYNGFITETNTYYPWNLNNAVEEIKNIQNDKKKKYDTIWHINEVVFHDPISMKYLCKVIKKPRLLDLQESDKEYQKLLLEPNYFLPKEPIKNNIEPDISKEPFYCYPLESNYTGAKPNQYSSISFFKMMAKLCKIDSKLNKKKIIEEIKKKIPYLYSNRKEQNIQALKDFTMEDKKRSRSRSRNGNSRKQKRKKKTKKKTKKR